MSFLENLGKVFIRSAVNQVGRDTGRVVSNKIYGNAHATPIKGVSQQNGVIYDDTDGSTITEAEFAKRLKGEGYKVKYFTTHPFLKAICLLVGFVGTFLLIKGESSIWSYIPPCLLLLMAFLKLICSYYTMDVYKLKEMPIYKSDLRYKDGKRFAGYQIGELNYEILPTKLYKSNMLAISIIYTFIAIIMFVSSSYFSSIGEAFSWSMLLILYFFIVVLIYAMHFCFKFL